LDFSSYSLRRGGRRIASDHPARPVDQEFGEIPFDRRTEQPRFLMLQVVEQRMRMAAIDIDLGEHRKRHVILALAERLDLFGVARLLPPELVAREAEHRKAAWRKFALQLLHALVLRREPAGARSVD